MLNLTNDTLNLSWYMTFDLFGDLGLFSIDKPENLRYFFFHFTTWGENDEADNHKKKFIQESIFFILWWCYPLPKCKVCSKCAGKLRQTNQCTGAVYQKCADNAACGMQCARSSPQLFLEIVELKHCTNSSQHFLEHLGSKQLFHQNVNYIHHNIFLKSVLEQFWEKNCSCLIYSLWHSSWTWKIYIHFFFLEMFTWCS